MKLLLGTTNPGKISDFREYLIHANLELLTLKDIGFWDEPLEIGKTYEENAIQKAKFYADKTEYPTLSDDGGFEVDALDGRPGVESRRWVGPNGTDQDRLDKLFKMMEGEPPERRAARLRTVTAVYFPQERELIMVEEKIEGNMPQKPSPVMIPGFPYRSALFISSYNKCYSEFSAEEHEAVNHRAQACRELLLKLEPYLN
ncbi:MAG: non-canonical purine NTP pyrophosphatase [Candidatus Doudnabacteria bacterium]|nr:non-canonical purine NTP pyrophosphatase [bacterium]MDZ4243515.1 non-canonical purine NTP pyrophosphatase [Candidatus Doudnabacteria bacterium]